MKMMNAEMEFVTFDAQDVITTSGGISFKVTSSLFDLSDSEWSYFRDNPMWTNGFPDFAITDKGRPLTDGQYYTIAEGANYYYTFNNDDGGRLWFNTGLTAGNTGAEEKTTLSSIIEWLGTHGTPGPMQW